MRIIACLASTLDGKIASIHSPKQRFGSAADWDCLLKIRDQADAILCGAETFRQHPAVRQGKNQTTTPLQCIMTRRMDLSPDASLFKDSLQQTPPTPIVIVSPQPVPEERRKVYPSRVEWLIQASSENPVPLILDYLAHKNINTLLVEGGGHIINLFLEAKALQEFYLTICPLFLGGKESPGLLHGHGFSIQDAPRTELLHSEWLNQELYLHLKLHYH